MTARQEADSFFDSSVGNVRLVSSTRVDALRKMHIQTVRDLLTTYPHRYIDLSTITTIADAPIGQTVTVMGVVDEVNEKQPRPRMNILEVSLVDDSGVLMGVWFRQPWMAKRFSRGMRVAFSGKVSFDYGYKRMNSPFIEVLGEGTDAFVPQLVPVHPATEGLSQTWMRRFVANAVEQASDVTDPLPASLRSKYRLMSRKTALRAIHFPQDWATRNAARRRLAYEEVLYLQVEMMRRRDLETSAYRPVAHRRGAVTDSFTSQLPFSLTDEQQVAIDEIADDMCAEKSMNRMLLGDVGTGKTVVAAHALVIAAESGHQAAMMAPTEVLARQYGEKLGPMLEQCGIRWVVLTGSTDAADRQEIIDGLASGAVQVVFGTHALIEPTVEFSSLSLVVIDEQHRFGVKQRSVLRMKGPGSDLLVMTATPIPRTLALALYGDLQTSYIRKRPASRPATITRVISRDARATGYDAIRTAVKEGRQAYIVCPLVGVGREQRNKDFESGQMQQSLLAGSDLTDPKAAEQEAEYLASKVFPQFTVGLLTGRMSSAEKQSVMADFRAGRIDVLVSTTVIEVGVDVPNATVMMVEDAERFGLAQLHQLRGRVGRGEYPGQVFLVADIGKDDDEGQARMDALVSTDDGFELAELDLKNRREGNVLGSRQHGASALKLVNVFEDAKLIAAAHDDARAILDGTLELSDEQSLRLMSEIALVFSGYDEPDVKGA